MEENLFIYILRLESNKYYVGKTKDLFTRFESHRNGNASTWTKKYRPLFVERVIERASIFDEDKYTKEYMNKYGIDNVRGGTYVMENLPEDQIMFLRREITAANDACLRCGIIGHFISNCKSKTGINDLNTIINNNNNSNNINPNNINNINNNTNSNNNNNNNSINNTNNINNNSNKINSKVKNSTKTKEYKNAEISNKGKKWSIDEDNKLCNSYKSGTSIAELAKVHQRTEYAIKVRLKKLKQID